MSEALDRLGQRVRERAERRARQEAEERAKQEAWLERIEQEQREVGKRFDNEGSADRADRAAAWQATLDERHPKRTGPNCPSCNVFVDINAQCRCR